MEFTYRSYPVIVIFGAGIMEKIAEEIKNKPGNSIMVISSPRYQHIVKQIGNLSGKNLIHFDQIAQHVPEKLALEAKTKMVKDTNLLLAIGGGSAIGLAKVLALESGLPLWAVPTTYSGSEMTNIYGISAERGKIVDKSDSVLPEKVFYDPTLSLGMPLELASTSAMNALAHLIEALYSSESNPITYRMSILGINHILQGMKMLAKTKSLTTAINEKLLFGAFLGGKALLESSMGLHHKAAHVIGGTFNLNHAKTHTVLLPHILKYQWDYLKRNVKEDLVQAFEHPFPPQAIIEIIKAMGTPYNLRQLGFKSENIKKATALICEEIFNNPAPVEAEKIESLLTDAFEPK
jgi:maleylacetate reductase